MSKKAKKGGPSSNFKLVAKIDSEAELVQELQLKKKYLEEKYMSVKSNYDETKKKLLEAKARLQDIKNIKENEDKKFDAISSDFKNQKGLMEMNYTDKIQALENIKKEKILTIQSLEQKSVEMKTEHQAKLDAKNKLSQNIKNNMDELSKFFSMQLAEIQKNLQEQIDKISNKWETNITEHLKRYEEHVKKYDINKE